MVIASALVARSFGAEAFATFTFVHLTATSLSNIAMLGMMNGLPRFFARMAIDPSADASAQALLSLAIVAIGLSIALAAILVLPDELIGLTGPNQKALLALLTATVGLNNLFTGATNGLERFGRVAWSSIVVGVVLVLGTAWAILSDRPAMPLYAYLVATVVGLTVLAPPVLRTLLRRVNTHSLSVSREARGGVMAYLGPMLVVTAMTNSGLWVAGRSLLHNGAAGLESFSEFALGMQWFGLASMASNVVSRTVMPRLVRHRYENDEAAERDSMRLAVALSVLGAVCVLVVVSTSAPFILRFYGDELSGARWSLTAFVAAAVFAAPVSVLSTKYIAAARYGLVLRSTTAWWIILAISSVVVAKYGAVAVCLAVLGAYGIYLLTMQAGLLRRRCT